MTAPAMLVRKPDVVMPLAVRGPTAEDLPLCRWAGPGVIDGLGRTSVVSLVGYSAGAV